MTNVSGTVSTTGPTGVNQPHATPSPAEQAKQLSAAADSLKAQQSAAAADAKAAESAWNEIARELEQYEREYAGLKDSMQVAATRRDDRLRQLEQLIPTELEAIKQAIKDYDDGPLLHARKAHDTAKTALSQESSNRDRAATAAETAKRALDALKTLHQDVKSKLQVADGLWKEVDEKFDNDQFTESYVLTSEKLKPAVDALPILHTAADYRQKITQAWQTWFDAKATLRVAEDQLLAAQRTWETAKTEYEKVQAERVQELLDTVATSGSPSANAA